jgi:predicted RND superfamily exporter protein
LLLRINGSSSDLGFCLRLIEFIEQTATVVLQLEAEEVRWFAQGAFVDRVTNYRQIQRDILRIAGISGILVSALLLIAYRRATIFLSLGFPLICFFGVALGAISTLGIHLSPITFCCLCSLTLLLLTMAVHLHDRYITEATASPDHRDNALRRAVILAGQGNLMATLIITAIGVQLLWFDLPDFMTAGWIIIAGAIFSFLSVQLLTSASIKVFILPTRRRSVSLHITNLGVGRIAWGAMAFPRACLAMVAMVACYNAWYALNLNYSPTVLPEATLQTQNSVADWRQARRMKPVPKHVHLVLKGESMEELLQENDRLFAYISRQLDAPDIEIFSLRNILPSLKSQEESRKKLLETREFNDANLTRQLEEAASEAGLNFEPVFGEFLKYLESMRQYATSGPYIRWSDLRDYQLKRGIQRYLSKDNNQLVVLTRVSAPSETMRREVSSLLPELKRTFPGIVVSSLQEVENEYQRLLQRSLALLMIISYLTLAGLFLLLLKQFRLTVLVLIVMSLVLVLYLGTIQLSGLSLSPLLVGMALVVNSMMLVNVCQFLARLRDPTGEFDFTSEQSNKWYYRAIEYTGRSIMLSHLVLAVIFITLLLADRTELLILGRTGFFINAQAFIATLGVLPCLLAILGPENSKVSDLVGSDDPTWLHEMFATQTSSKPV